MTSPRSDPARAWRDLTEGRMAILAHHDRGGRRHLLLRPSARGPLVTERQRLVLVHRAYCLTLARIAEELEVSVPTIANELGTALERVGLTDDTELPVVFGMGLLPAGGRRIARAPGLRSRGAFSVPSGLRAQSARYRGKPAVSLSFPVPKVEWRSGLTSAERDVAGDILAGLPNGAIGRKRGSSVRTVVNQVASIFRKLGAHSRLELSLVVHTGRNPPVSRGDGRDARRKPTRRRSRR